MLPKIMKPYVIVPLVSMAADVKIRSTIVSRVHVIIEEIVFLEPLHILVPVHLVNSVFKALHSVK